MAKARGPEKFDKFLEKNGISRARAARGLKVSHVTVLNWVTKRAKPTPFHRRAIRVWTNEEVVESDWETDEERARSVELDAVRPFSEEPAA